MNLKPGTQIWNTSLNLPVHKPPPPATRQSKKDNRRNNIFLHGSYQCMHIVFRITDASKQKIEQPDTERRSTEGCKFSKLLELNFVLNFVHICSFPSLFLNFLRPSDVCVLQVYCNRGTMSCFHDAPREMKFLTFHRRITSVLFNTSPHSLSFSHTRKHKHA
jgi:hypothetical protein